MTGVWRHIKPALVSQLTLPRLRRRAQRTGRRKHQTHGDSAAALQYRPVGARPPHWNSSATQPLGAAALRNASNRQGIPRAIIVRFHSLSYQLLPTLYPETALAENVPSLAKPSQGCVSRCDNPRANELVAVGTAGQSGAEGWVAPAVICGRGARDGTALDPTE